jgi:prenyltransferase beta subunit
MMLIQARRLLAALIAATVLAGAVAAVQPAQARAASVSRALSYLHARQTKAGGFGGPSQSQVSATPWCILAIAAAGQPPASWHRSGGHSPIQYLQSVDLNAAAQQTANPATCYAIVAIAYHAAHENSLIFHAGSKHINLVSKLLSYRRSSGQFTFGANNVNTTAWAIMALKAAGSAASARAAAVAWLEKQATAGGGFSYRQGGSPDADDTAAVVQALRAGGVGSSSAVIHRALTYLHSQQLSNGGVRSSFGAGANTESTAWTIQAVVATAGNPAGPSWKKGGHTLMGFVNGMQARSGLFYHVGTIASAPLLTTSQAIVALKRRPYPL